MREDWRFLLFLCLFISIICILYWSIIGWDSMDTNMSRLDTVNTLLETKEFQSSYAFLTVMYYAAWAWIFGTSPVVFKISLLVVYCVAGIVIYFAAKGMFHDRWAGRIASVVLASSPLLYQQTLTVGYELLSACAVSLILLTAVRASREQTLLSAGTVGLIAGLAALVKSAIGFVGFMLIPYFVLLRFFDKGQGNIWKRCIVTMTLFAVPLALWMTRNRIEYGYFAMGDPAYSGYTLFYGNNPWATKGFGMVYTPEARAYEQAIRDSVPPGDSIALGNAFREDVKKTIRSDPFFWLVGMGIKKIWCGLKFYSREEILHWGPLMGLALFGLWVLPRWGKHTLIVHLIFLYYLMMTYIFFGFSRFRVAYIPVLVLAATSAVLWVSARLDRRRLMIAVAAYASIFIVAYAFAKPLRELWHFLIPQLRM